MPNKLEGTTAKILLTLMNIAGVIDLQLTVGTLGNQLLNLAKREIRFTRFGVLHLVSRRAGNKTRLSLGAAADPFCRIGKNVPDYYNPISQLEKRILPRFFCARMHVAGTLAFLFLVQTVLAQQPTPLLPNPKLTPDDVFDVTAQDICVPGYAEKGTSGGGLVEA